LITCHCEERSDPRAKPGGMRAIPIELCAHSGVGTVAPLRP
jgi:hypothetical protein